jgi:ABC-type branched-subunit amino acid transport system substrate-binding protein
MIIDAWMQHPNVDWITNPIFDPLRRWQPGPWSEINHPLTATLAEMDKAGVARGMLCAWCAPSGPMISNDEVAQHCRAYDPLVADFTKRNLNPVIDLQIGPENQDASQHALRIAEIGADAVLLVLYPKPGTAVTRGLAKLGYKPILIGQTAIDPLTLANDVGIPGAADRYVTPATVRHLPSDPEMKGWMTLLKDMFPHEEPSTFNLMGVGAAQVMVAALKAAGPDLTRERYLAAMAHIRVETDTLSSTIVCDDPVSHQCNKTPAWIGMVNGRLGMINPRN